MEMYFLVIKVVKGDKDLFFFAKFKKKKLEKSLIPLFVQISRVTSPCYKLKKVNFPITQKLTEVIEKFFLFVVWNPIPFHLSTFVQHLIIWNCFGHVSIFV